MAKKADLSPERAHTGKSSYPPPFDEAVAGRKSWILSSQFRLTQFGVNLVEIPPGGWSTQRHWHRTNDELVVVIAGEITVVDDDGEEVLGPGDSIAFKAGVPNAHHIQNRGTEPARFYDIGGRDPYDVSTFPEMGLEGRMHMSLTFKEMRKR